MRRIIIAALLVALALTGQPATASPSPTEAARCQEIAFPQAIGTLRGTLCRPKTGRPRATVLLVHGSTYDRRYWDPPALDPRRYSALRLLAARGYQAVAVDRLGSGASSRLSDEAQTADASADALHLVIAQLRRAPRWDTTSGKLFTVGHSSGSTLAIREAAAYDDVDGLVVTGLLHTPGIGAALFLTMLHPAADDPRFEDAPGIPAGYVTTIPGTRVLWYDIYGPDADPAVLAYDEAELKDAMPQVDSGGFVDEVFSGQPRSRQVHKPVLIVVGDRDYSHCDPGCPNAAAEPGFWPLAPSAQVRLVADAAHVLNLHESAAETTRLIGRWLDRQTRRGPA